MTENIAGLILAGGASRRMGGGDKSLMSLTGKRLIDHAIERLKPQVGKMAISANCEPELLADTWLPVLPDAPPAGRGPLAGILAGLEWAAAEGEASHLVTVAADTPFFPIDLVARLRAAGPEAAIVLASSDGRQHPVFGLWPVEAKNALGDWLRNDNPLKVATFVESRKSASCVFDDDGAFFNINTPQDLAEAEKRLVAQ
ncbi:MAG: molybdenum cofactor guanylyltransferase MobA [Rhizobiaceae bacterium]|nr:molybdenum cofactor guanylyltransferase MobA [Rhizobiaceae bacterium]